MMNEIYGMLDIYIRSLAANVLCMLACFYLLHLVLGIRSKKRLLFVGFLLLYKVIWVNTIVRYILMPQYMDTEWCQLLYFVTVLANLFFGFFCPKMTYRGSLVKVMLATCVCEMAATLIFFVTNAAMNLPAGLPAAEVYIPVQWSDLWGIVIFAVLFGILCFLFAKKLKRLRSKEPRHRKALGCLEIGYILMAIYSVLNDPYDFGSYFDVVKVTLLVIVAVVTAVGVQIFHIYRKRVKLENEYYHLSQNLMETYYGELLSQTQKIKQYQKTLQLQMEEMQKYEKQELSSEKLTAYLTDLRQQYDEITMGIYCQDWVIDALLSQKKKLCKEKGIQIEFYFQNYQGSAGQNKALLQQLVQTLDTAIQQVEKKKGDKYLKLQCSCVKGQIVLKVEQTGRKPESIMVGE